LIDIANLAGRIKTTASRALADSPLVREETKERIRQIAKEHHFQPNALARHGHKTRGVMGFCMYKHGGTPYVGHTFFWSRH
jgi:DNA-binding LacI/PurR family transcriptional regulator